MDGPYLIFEINMRVSKMVKTRQRQRTAWSFTLRDIILYIVMRSYTQNPPSPHPIHHPWVDVVPLFVLFLQVKCFSLGHSKVSLSLAAVIKIRTSSNWFLSSSLRLIKPTLKHKPRPAALKVLTCSDMFELLKWADPLSSSTLDSPTLALCYKLRGG